MRRALLLALSAGLLSGAFIAGLWLGQIRPMAPAAEPKPLSAAEARRLSDVQLRDRLLALLGDRVIETSGVPPANLPANISQGLDQISLSLPSVPAGWPGLCSARILALVLQTSDGRLPETAEDLGTVADVRTSTVYKIVGSADLNGDSIEPTKEQCHGEAFGDRYFLADESRDASEAARFIEEMQSASRQPGPLPFSVSCAPDRRCGPVRETLASLHAANLVMVTRLDTGCPADRSCMELVFETGEPEGAFSPPQMTAAKIVGRYRGVGARGWGVLRIETITVG